MTATPTHPRDIAELARRAARLDGIEYELRELRTELRHARAETRHYVERATVAEMLLDRAVVMLARHTGQVEAVVRVTLGAPTRPSWGRGNTALGNAKGPRSPDPAADAAQGIEAANAAQTASKDRFATLEAR